MIHQRLSTAFASDERPGPIGTGRCRRDLRSPTQAVIGALNRTLGTDFDANDGLVLEQWMADLAGDPGLVASACAKGPEGFRQAFAPMAREALARRRRRNAELLGALASEETAAEAVFDFLSNEFQANAQHRGV